MHLVGVVLLAAVTVLRAGGDAQSQILELEKQWSAANVARDVATLERIMADDYIGIESVGVVATKTQEIGDIRTGGVVVEAEQPTQMKVRLYGDAAVVTGHLSIRDRRDGKPGHHEVVFTDVWVKRDGRWQVVNYQATLLNEVPAATECGAKRATPESVEQITTATSLAEISALLGAPERDVGSGLHVLEWDCTDGRRFHVSIVDQDPTTKPMAVGFSARD